MRKLQFGEIRQDKSTYLKCPDLHKIIIANQDGSLEVAVTVADGNEKEIRA